MALQPIKKIPSRIISDSAITTDKLGYKDYFRVRLTTQITGLTDNVTYVVDFHNNGTVDFDTANGWSGDSNNRWQANASGIWQLGFSLGTGREDTNRIRDIIVAIEESSDGSNWQEVFQSAKRNFDGTQDDSTGYLSNSYIHPVTAGNYYRMSAFANTASGDWRIVDRPAGLIGGGPSSIEDQDALTFFWALRIY